MKGIHVALIEVEPLPGCTLCAPDVEGGFARCYVPATSPAAAEKAARAWLAKEHLHVVDVEWCVSYEDAEWENPTSEEAQKCAREAKKTGEVVIGRLDVWGRDA
jgi:hypothetical protein